MKAVLAALTVLTAVFSSTSHASGRCDVVATIKTKYSWELDYAHAALTARGYNVELKKISSSEKADIKLAAVSGLLAYPIKLRSRSSGQPIVSMFEVSYNGHSNKEARAREAAILAFSMVPVCRPTPVGKITDAPSFPIPDSCKASETSSRMRLPFLVSWRNYAFDVSSCRYTRSVHSHSAEEIDQAALAEIIRNGFDGQGKRDVFADHGLQNVTTGIGCRTPDRDSGETPYAIDYEYSANDKRNLQCKKLQECTGANSLSSDDAIVALQWANKLNCK